MFRVVIADDEKKVIQLMQKLIDWEGAGYEIVGTANDGLTALSLVETLHPDLLVTDIRMPGCSGIELLRRAKECQPGLLCIVVSGYREFEYAQSALKYGVEDYLLKPLNKNEMTGLLHKIRAKLSSGAELEYQMKQNAIRNQELLIRKLQDCAAAGMDFPDRETVNQEFGFRFVQGSSAVLLVKADLSESDSSQQNRRILEEHVLETVRKHIPMAAEEWAAAILPEGIAAVINTDEKGFPDLKRFVVRIRKSIEQERGLFGELRSTICLGRIQKDFSGLSHSYRSAVFLCEDRLCGKEFFRDGNAEAAPETLHYQIESGERIALQEAVELLSAEAFSDALDQSYANLIRHRELNGRMIRNWHEDISDLALFQLNSFGVESKRIKSELMSSFWSCGDAEQVKHQLKNGSAGYWTN